MSSLSPRRRRHQLLLRFCAADRKLQELEAWSGFFLLYLSDSASAKLIKRQSKVIKRLHQLMTELIPNRRKAKHFRYRYSDEFRENIDIAVFSLAVSAIKCKEHPFLLGLIAIRAQFTPAFLLEHRPLAAAVTETAGQTFRLLRQEAGRSFHGGDPLQNERLLQQLEQFDRVLTDFEFAWICDGLDLETVAIINEIQDLGDLFVRTAGWAVERGHVKSDDFGTCEPEVMTTLPRLAVLLHLTQQSADPRHSRDYKVFHKYRAELDEARSLLDQLEPPQRDAIAQRLCLRTEAEDGQSSRLFKVIAGVADQMQTNHPMESNYLMSQVCSRYSNAADAQLPVPDEVVEIEEFHAATGPVQWMPDSASTVCTNRACGLEFSPARRRHHCRACGQLFCHDCTARRLPLPLLGYHSPVRVCATCHDRVAEVMIAEEAPDWVPDSSSKCCSNLACSEDFSPVRRRHHCRACGRLFCHKCSSWRASLPHFGYKEAVRLCQYCHSVHGDLA